MKMETLPRWLVRLTQAGILLALACIVAAFLAGLLDPNYTLRAHGMPGLALPLTGSGLGNHSDRNACIGSTRDARPAGISPATRAQPHRSNAVAPSACG